MKAWPLSIATFFVALAVFNVWLISTALDSHRRSAVVSAHPYEEGLSYQESIDRQERFRRAGLHADISIDMRGKLVAIIRENDGREVPGLTITAKVLCLPDPTRDVQRMLTADSATPGVYTATLVPAPGLWSVHLTVSRKDGAQETELLEYDAQVLSAAQS